MKPRVYKSVSGWNVKFPQSFVSYVFSNWEEAIFFALNKGITKITINTPFNFYGYSTSPS